MERTDAQLKKDEVWAQMRRRDLCGLIIDQMKPTLNNQFPMQISAHFQGFPLLLFSHFWLFNLFGCSFLSVCCLFCPSVAMVYEMVICYSTPMLKKDRAYHHKNCIFCNLKKSAAPKANKAWETIRVTSERDLKTLLKMSCLVFVAFLFTDKCFFKLICLFRGKDFYVLNNMGSNVPRQCDLYGFLQCRFYLWLEVKIQNIVKPEA